MQRAFILLWTAVAIFAIGLMAMLYASLLPHFIDIGDWFVWVVRLGMICGSVLMIAFTWFKMKSMYNYSKFTRHGEVVSYIGRNHPHVVSAIHEAAKVQQIKALPEPSPSWQAVLDLRKDGKGMHQIAKDLKVPYNKVRDFLNSVEKNESEL